MMGNVTLLCINVSDKVHLYYYNIHAIIIIIIVIIIYTCMFCSSFDIFVLIIKI